MARLQILRLPSLVDGQVITPRFALVLDQCSSNEKTAAEYRAWAETIGAVGLLSTIDTIEVVTGSPDADSEDEDSSIAMVGLVWNKDQPDITKTVVDAAREVLSRFVPTTPAPAVRLAGDPWKHASTSPSDVVYDHSGTVPTREQLERLGAEKAARTGGLPA